MSVSADICKLNELRAQGVLDDHAFARAKHQVLRTAARESEPQPDSGGRGRPSRRIFRRVRG